MAALASYSNLSEHQNVKTTRGAADTDGVDYENLMRLLVLLRLLEDENVKEFYIAENVHELGTFGDLVIKVEYDTPPGEDTATTKLILVQLKHCQNKNTTIVSTELTNVDKKGGKFQLKEYYDSYKTICSKIGQFENGILNDYSVEDMTFVLFTNAKCAAGDKTNRSSSFWCRKLLETGVEDSDVFRIDSSQQFEKIYSEMKKNKNTIIQEESGSKFLQKLVIFSEQSNVNELENILKEKINDYVAGDNVPVEFALQMGLNFITKNSSKWLSRHAGVLSEIEFLYQGIAVKLSEAEHFWTISITRKILVKHICSDVRNGAISVGKDMDRSEDYYVDRSLRKATKKEWLMKMEDEWRIETSKKPLVLICGVPGMGKSSFFTRQAELIKSQSTEKYVIRRNLVDYSEYFSKINVEGNTKNAAKMFLEEISGVSPGTLEYEMFVYSIHAKDMMIIFLDGVDEISPNYYNKLLVVIQTIQKIFKVQLFVSTRPVMKERIEKDLRVVHWQLDKFQNRDTDLFFEKYCKVDKKQFGIVSRYGIRDLSILPIFCKMVGDIINTNNEPDAADIFKNVPNKPQVYDKFVDMMFEAYHRDKLNVGVNVQGAQYLLENQKKVLLEQHETLSLLQIFREDELQILKENIQSKSKEFLTKIFEGKEKTGFIINIIDGRPIFLHHSIAEYFCGKWFARHESKYMEFVNKDNYFPDEVNFFMSYKLRNQHKLFTTILNVLEQKEIEAALAEFKSELNHLDSLNRSVLHYAAISKNKWAARYLLYNGFVTDEMVHHCELDVFNIVGKEILLFWLSTILVKYKGLKTNVNLLISLLMLAIYGEIKFFLLQNSKHCPLHIAILNGNKEGIAELLNSEDINSRNVLGLTPLHLAVYMEDTDTVRSLGRRGAEYSNDNVFGACPQQSAISYIKTNMLNILIEFYLPFLKGDISVREVQDEDYASQGLLLHDAVQKENLERVKDLITSEGCDINETDSKGRTVLHVAMTLRTDSKSSFLEALQGINYAQDFNGFYAHHYAQAFGTMFYDNSLGYAFACGLELLPEEDKKIFNKEIKNIICNDVSLLVSFLDGFNSRA